jgi:hypothetical protein
MRIHCILFICKYHTNKGSELIIYNYLKFWIYSLVLWLVLKIINRMIYFGKKKVKFYKKMVIQRLEFMLSL